MPRYSAAKSNINDIRNPDPAGTGYTRIYSQTNSLSSIKEMLRIQLDTANQTPLDGIGSSIGWYFQDDGLNTSEIMAKMTVSCSDVSAGSEDTAFNFWTMTCAH